MAPAAPAAKGSMASSLGLQLWKALVLKAPKCSRDQAVTVNQSELRGLWETERGMSQEMLVAVTTCHHQSPWL